jgi:hypothetical protein
MGSTVPNIGRSTEVGDFSWPRNRSDGRQQTQAPVDVLPMTRGYLVA